jgi:2-C-methyl-D-erythritol 4-phosphate cytidylyltransferase/2-C-methyl-D-erythritol 2,4-cyclodiphosphate synthase
MAMEHGITALIVAAGQGNRAGLGIAKQYRDVDGKTVLAHAIDALDRHPAITRIQVVIGEGQHSAYQRAIGGRHVLPPVIGGVTRRASVVAGLAHVETDHVLIHDAARPFVPASVIDRLIEALESNDGAVPALTVNDSLARASGFLGDSVDRAYMVRVQTPQAFRSKAIVAAHLAWPEHREATDDAQVLRAAGGNVAVVPGDILLEKLTYEDDFDDAGRRLRQAMISRTGFGTDVHAFGGKGPVWLGGIAVPHARGLSGHSDADVALHALTDALLGAASLGDIGDHFPPSDPKWKGAPSRIFLEHAAKLIRDRGGVIDHADVTIICEEPRVGPFRKEIRTSIAAMLNLDPGKISVKATTTEKLGFTGRGEGIAAQAVATIRMKDIE